MMILRNFAIGLFMSLGAAGSVSADDRVFAHIIVIIEENHRYDQIIGNAAAPNINALAEEYGNATHFYGEVHPSEANYVAMLGGNTFGIHDDDAWYCRSRRADVYCSNRQQTNYADHTIQAKSLVDQLAEHGLTWKGYFEAIPAPGSKAVFSRGSASEPAQLYAVKHNGFMNFAGAQRDPRRAEKIVGFEQLARDLASGAMPTYAHIVPNQCNEMHGLSDNAPNARADCGFNNDKGRIARGDAKIGELVRQIQASPIWSALENAAIVITWDEDDAHPHAGEIQGCCGYDPKSPANFGGGHIPTLVITNHGPRGVIDDTLYNHYSLLRTTEDAFKIGEHLGLADDSAHGVATMEKLFWK